MIGPLSDESFPSETSDISVSCSGLEVKECMHADEA